MDIELARTFLEIVRMRSFVRAAEQLNVSQTAVSARVKALEEQLGRPLFIRNKNGASLTPAGEQFLRYAPMFVQLWQRARHQVAVPPGRRAVLGIGEGLPTPFCIEANAHALARYAALCQEAGLVPIVEPEVLMDGGHTLERCRAITEETLHSVFLQLYAQGVALEGMILKPNMVVPGLSCKRQETVEEVADATVKCLLRVVPAAVGGIAFLSGGQPAELASARLSAMNSRFRHRLPWPLTFSFARAIQQPALEIWKGEERNVSAAQQALYRRAKDNRDARRGEYGLAV